MREEIEMNLMFWKKPQENHEDRKNRVESEIKTKLSELTYNGQIEVLSRIVPLVDPDRRVYRYHRGRKAA